MYENEGEDAEPKLSEIPVRTVVLNFGLGLDDSGQSTVRADSEDNADDVEIDSIEGSSRSIETIAEEQRERVRGIVALLAVGLWAALVCFTTVAASFDDDGLTTEETQMAYVAVTPVVTGVIGFYFGSVSKS